MTKNIFIYGLLVCFTACGQSKQTFTSPKEYDLNHPQVFKMPDELVEISGIAFYKGDDKVLYAEQDEEGKLYWLRLGDEQANHFKFGNKGDYEDVALTNDAAFLLRSDGALFSFLFNGINMTANHVREWKNLLPKGEYESLFADTSENKLYVLCKNCSLDKKGKTTHGYIFNITNDTIVSPSGKFQINAKQIVGLRKDFRPSALTKNTLTNEWYVLSSINKMLVVSDTNWQVKNVYPLNQELYNQPEGITFDKEHNLYISNEGFGLKRGTVLKFTYRK